jgi:tripartite-type tricarboxylate transporter receptor subunit TctC
MLRNIMVLFSLIFALIQSTTITTAGNFEGKTITYIISTKPGGGYDSYGRLIAKYLEKHLTGSSIIVKNIPGGGHRIAAETIYASPADGLTIGIFNSALIYGQIAGMYGDSLDLAKMSWIGKAAADSRVLVVSAKSNINSIEDLKKLGRPIKIAVNGKGSSAHIESALIGQMLGLDFQHIFGFEGNESTLSLMRGEVDATVGSHSSLEDFVASGEGRFILGYGGKVEKDVPQLSSLINPTSGEKSLLSLIEAQGRFVRVTVGPPGIPDNILKELRDAYMAAVNDPELLAEAAKSKLPIDPAGGEEVAQAIKASLQQSPDIVAALKKLVSEE